MQENPDEDVPIRIQAENHCQAKPRCSMFSRSGNIELTCTMPHVVRVLKTNGIINEIHIPLNLSFQILKNKYYLEQK